MFEIGNTLDLADKNEYLVVDKYTDNNTVYVYLADVNSIDNVIFGKVQGDSIEIITDPDELEKVIKQVYEHTHNSLKEDQ